MPFDALLVGREPALFASRCIASQGFSMSSSLMSLLLAFMLPQVALLLIAAGLAAALAQLSQATIA
jgi:hypothetical protein